MKVKCYPEGDDDRARTYDVSSTTSLMLQKVAQRYVEDHRRHSDRFDWNICISPDDDEARAASGWHPPETNDPEELPFRMFVVHAIVTVTLEAAEVSTFNPARQKVVEGATTTGQRRHEGGATT